MKAWYFILLYFVFSPFVWGQSVVLQGFEKNGHHVLEWVVTECSYISHFDIERSTDGSRFEIIYTREVKSYDCNGNYTQTLVDIPKGYKYEYRIKAYLNTALPVISGITTIFYQPENVEITNFVFNNAFIQMSVISRQRNALTVGITDVMGKIHYKNTFEIPSGKQDIQLQTNILSTGIYFVHITDRQNHLVYHRKCFIKTH